MLNSTGIMQAINEGLVTMVVGMGIVFIFLTILVFAIDIMAKIVSYVDKICPPPTEETKTKTKKRTSDDTEIAIAIAIANAQ